MNEWAKDSHLLTVKKQAFQTLKQIMEQTYVTTFNF